MIEPIGQTILREIEKKARAESGREIIAYRGQCPRCMKWQIRESLFERGCFACGWKSERGKNGSM